MLKNLSRMLLLGFGTTLVLYPAFSAILYGIDFMSTEHLFLGVIFLLLSKLPVLR